jgi:prefoldin subunit 1
VYSPQDEITEKISKESETLKADVEALNKRLHYLETTHKNSKDIEQIFKNGGR